jgi:hypothetical protein
MNYKNTCLQELKDMSKDNEDYTFGDLLFSFLQPIATEKGISLSFLRNIEDVKYYTLIEKSRERELDKNK